jgi:hypothetical protein
MVTSDQAIFIRTYRRTQMLSKLKQFFAFKQ